MKLKEYLYKKPCKFPSLSPSSAECYTYTGKVVYVRCLSLHGIMEAKTCFHEVNSQHCEEWTQYILCYILTETDRKRSNWKDICYSKFSMEQPSCLKTRFIFFIHFVSRKEGMVWELPRWFSGPALDTKTSHFHSEK